MAGEVYDVGIEDCEVAELPPELADELSEFDVIVGAALRQWASDMERSLVERPADHMADMPLSASIGGSLIVSSVIGQQRLSTGYRFRGRNRPIVIP